MKFSIITILLLSTALFSPSFASGRFDCDSIPALNQKVMDYVSTTIGKKVGNGECWELAAKALELTHARWDHNYKYGREVNPAKECIYPGDFIQFEGVVIKYRKGTRDYQETMSHHTAIVYGVKDKGVFVIIHQNNGFSGKKVGLSDLDLKTVVRGKMKFYRPVN